MKKNWFIFWFLCLLAFSAAGAWRAALAQTNAQMRGIERPTRTSITPQRIPLAGVNVELTHHEDLDAELEQIAALGFVWLRQPFLWAEIEPQPGRYEWAAYDRIVEAVAARGGRLQLVALLDGTPPWARHRAAPEHPFAPPESPAAFADFARALAERYGETIDYYQIWDEPNIKEHWGGLDPRPALYVAMLDGAYHAIHGVDAGAVVIAAALAPTTESGPDNLNDPAYLRAIYTLGGGNSFDAAAGKPYGFDFPPSDRTVDLNRLNFSRLILLREVMLDYGDGHKALWGSNWGWNALPEDWRGEPSIWGNVTAAQQRDYTHQALERAAQEWTWAGGLILQHWQPNYPADHPIQGFAIAPRDWAGVVPAWGDAMPPGYYPAVNPYAVYAGDWTFSALGADGGTNAERNTITLRIEGTEFALAVRRGDYLAYLSVTVDGQPANALPRNREGEAFIALTAATREPVIDLILAADGLSAGVHEVVITQRPALGDDHFPIVGFAVGAAPQTNQTPKHAAQGVFFLTLAGAFLVGWGLPWGALRPPGRAALRNAGDFLLGLFFSGVVMVGALLTWHDTLAAALRRELPAVLVSLATASLLYYAPSTWIALGGLLLAGVVIFSRPWLGVVQIVFWSAFFTSNLDPFFRAIALVEALLVVTLAATLARFGYDYARREDKTIQIRLLALDWGMLALVLWGAASLSWAAFLPQALREWRVMLVEPALLYLLIRTLKPSLRDLAFLVEALLFTGFLLAAIGIVAYFTDESVVIAEGGTRRLLSVYGSPNAVGLLLGRTLPFALAYGLLPVGEWRRIYAGVTGLTMLVAVLLTQSMGALLLGLPAALVVVLMGRYGQRALPILAGVGGFSAAALVPLSMVFPRLRQLADFENNTTVLRLNLWRSTAQLLQDHPLTGVGLDQFLYAYRSRYILPAAWQDPDLSHPHQVLLDYWVRLGILGVVLGVWLQWLFWRGALRVVAAVREQNALAWAIVLGAMGAMANFLAHGLVDMAHFNINLSYIFAVLLALVATLTATE